MDRWIDILTEVRLNEWLHESKNKWMNRRVDWWIGGMNKQMYVCLNGCITKWIDWQDD